MPGSIANAAPSTVLPLSLSRSFAPSREYALIENEYKDGTSQRSLQATTSRKRWKLTKRLTPTQLSALRTFYFARNGPLDEFYFYDPYETSPKFSYDPTGAATAGRYTVRFDGPWQQLVTFSRADADLALAQLA